MAAVEASLEPGRRTQRALRGRSVATEAHALLSVVDEREHLVGARCGQPLPKRRIPTVGTRDGTLFGHPLTHTLVDGVG